ncbi:hypothetical protein GCM10023214_15160 [Amycolatopsis dongchuanensis]|uniref:Uncharacterized protein n=1 Tax=Amycolatopsis dongchuanensis TaxID=1070866 RepID=A0ABP9Q4Q6_9PSEU
MRYPAGNDIEVAIEMAGRPHFMYWFVPGGREHPENALVVKDCASGGSPASDGEPQLCQYQRGRYTSGTR